MVFTGPFDRVCVSYAEHAASGTCKLLICLMGAIRSAVTPLPLYSGVLTHPISWKGVLSPLPPPDEACLETAHRSKIPSSLYWLYKNKVPRYGGGLDMSRSYGPLHLHRTLPQSSPNPSRAPRHRHQDFKTSRHRDIARRWRG